MSVYRLASAGCKKDFNECMLPVIYIWSYIKKGNRVKHQYLEVILQFGKGGKFRIASKLSSEFDVSRSLSPSHILNCFLLALYTNLAADKAKLGMWCYMRMGGRTPKLV